MKLALNVVKWILDHGKIPQSLVLNCQDKLGNFLHNPVDNGVVSILSNFGIPLARECQTPFLLRILCRRKFRIRNPGLFCGLTVSMIQQRAVSPTGAGDELSATGETVMNRFGPVVVTGMGPPYDIFGLFAF